MILKKQKQEDEHQVNTDRYMITYADLITLLLGLFVILYASSQVDEERYKQLSKAFGEYFKPDKALEGGNGVMTGDRKGIPAPVLPPSEKKMNLEQVKAEAQRSLSSYINNSLLSLKQDGSSLIITLPEKLLFIPGSADIRRGGDVLDSLAGILAKAGNQVMIDGHTDSKPIKNGRFESNWHLSVNRASNVGYRLIQMGLPENCVVVRGYGSQRPVADNNTAEGRTENRRVELTITELPTDAPSTEGYNRPNVAENKNNK